MPIASAAAACADSNARLPLPVNRDQTRLYRAIFDELGANGTVALKGKRSVIDPDDGKVILYDELDEFDQNQYIGMMPQSNGHVNLSFRPTSEQVYVVCEACQSVQSTPTGNTCKIYSDE